MDSPLSRPCEMVPRRGRDERYTRPRSRGKRVAGILASMSNYTEDDDARFAAGLLGTAEDVRETPVGSGSSAPRPRWSPPAAGSPRRPIIPRWLPFAAGGVVVLSLIVVGLVLWNARLATVRVPALVGLDRTAASTRLQELGLTMRVGDRRFSDTVPPGQIVDQSPVPGTQVQEGAEVVVALSAGTENFPMPDVTGMTLEQARTILRDRGLSVEVLTVASDRPQGTVIESFPSPGVTVATGTQVRVSVAAGNGTGGALLPSDMTGKTFMLDPEPVPGGADVSMDVARRLRALLEASGAKVMVTREVTDSGAAAGTLNRARRAKETSSTALIGFSVAQSGAAGLVVMSLPATGSTQPYYLASASLATALGDALRVAGKPVAVSIAAADLILTGTGVPAVRLRLGSLAAADDKLSFTDPQWADDVARAVYRAMSSVYGAK
jgi:hypothetical protein